jgi:long-chain fatty acid transport protein
MISVREPANGEARMKPLRIGGYAVAVGLMVTSSAQAGGLYLQEFMTPNMGTAAAGAQARADSAATAFENVAGMTRLKHSELMVGAGLGISDVRFDPDDNTPVPGTNSGQAGGPFPILSLNYVHKITDDLAAGLGLISVAGASLDYNNGWVGRFQNQEVDLLTLSAIPSLAYRITDWLSVGAGAQILYATMDVKAALPTPLQPGDGRVKVEDADDVDVGFVGGVLLEPLDGTRIGVTYQSKVEPKLSGDVSIEPIGAQAGIDIKLPLVETVRVGVYQDITEQWAVLGSLRWENWSQFGNLPISTDRGSRTAKTGWHDTYGFNLGVNYRPADQWLLQAGFAYDSSPVSDGNRNAMLPVDRQLRYAAGVQYQWNERVNIGGAFEYADMGDAKIDSNVLKGDYEDNQIFFFGLNVSYKFGVSSGDGAVASGG